MDQEDYQKHIELEILRLIEERLKSGEMNAQEAQEIAKYVLQVLPSQMTLDEIYKLVPSLSEHYSELSKVVAPVITEYEDKVKNIVLPKIHEMLQGGRIDDATQIVKHALNHVIHIE